MSKFVVAISVNKVQSFIYHVIKGNSASAETEDKTLKTIQLASWDISKKFKKIVRKVFNINKENTLLFITGKAIFYSELPEEEILEKLKDIFKFYYYNYKGEVQIKYNYFKSDNYMEDKLKLVKKCTQNLKSTDCTNKVIEDNKDLIFGFPEEDYNRILGDYIKKWEIGDTETNNEEDYGVFVKGLNEFVPEVLQKNNEIGEDKKSYKIAVIKADIDGMGNIFKNQEKYDNYKKISEILENKISIKNLEEHLCFNKIKLFPLYIAGDDIFFAVSVSDIFNGVSIIKNMIDDINNDIAKGVNKDLKLSVSVGIDITQNDQPIRYYYERVEEQLKEAKKKGEKLDSKTLESVRVSICFDGMKFYIYDKDAENIDYDTEWYSMYKNILMMSYAKLKTGDSLSTSYFYNLLEVLQDKEINKDDRVYTNAVFYRLLPSCNEVKRINKLELAIKSLMMRKLASEEKGRKPRFIIGTNNGKNIKYKIEEEYKKRLENIVRLFLLFTDERYAINANLEVELGYESNKKRLDDLLKEKNIVQSYVAPVLNYLYNESLVKTSCEENLRDVFIKETVVNNIPHIHRIKIEKSMFFKMKRIMDTYKDNTNYAVKKISQMIVNVGSPKSNQENTKDKEGVQTQNSVQENKNCGLQFDEKIFLENAEEGFTKDFIDSLMLYYEYKKLYALKR